MTAGKNIATSANNTKDRGEYIFSKKFVSATGTFKKNFTRIIWILFMQSIKKQDSNQYIS